MRVVREVSVVKETHNWVKLRVPNGEVLTKKQGVCDPIRLGCESDTHKSQHSRQRHRCWLGVLKMLGQNRGHATYKKLPKTKSDHKPKSLIPCKKLYIYCDALHRGLRCPLHTSSRGSMYGMTELEGESLRKGS